MTWTRQSKFSCDLCQVVIEVDVMNVFWVNVLDSFLGLAGASAAVLIASPRDGAEPGSRAPEQLSAHGREEIAAQFAARSLSLHNAHYAHVRYVCTCCAYEFLGADLPQHLPDIW